MGVTSIPYDIRTWIYPGADPAADPSTWPMAVDVSAKVRYPGDDGGQVITYTDGRQDEAGQVDAGTLTLTLDNRDGAFSTKNRAGPYYGKLSRNTPIIVGTVSGYDTFTRTTTAPAVGTSDSGQAWTNGSAYATNGSGLTATNLASNTVSLATMNDSGATDYDMTLTVKASATTTGGHYGAGGVQKAPDGSYLRYTVFFETSGAVTATIARSSGGGSATVTLPWTYSAGQVFALHCQRTGAATRMKVWRPATETEPVAWTTSFNDNVVPPGDLGVFTFRVSGNTDNAFVFTFDSFTAVGIEFAGSVVQWPNDWSWTGTNSWASIQAAGILRRLQQGNGVIRSPLARQLPAYLPSGYWPLEDASGSASFGSALAGQLPATYIGVQPAGDTSLAGGAAAPTLSATNGRIYAKTTLTRDTFAGATGFAAMFFTKIPTGLTATKTQIAVIRTGPQRNYYIVSVSTASVWVDVYPYQGGATISSSVNAIPVDPTGWVAWQLETSFTLPTTSWALAIHQVGSTTYNAATGSFNDAAISYATSVYLGSSTLPVGTAFAHIWMGSNALPFVTDTFSLVSSGYAGELASDRVARLCFEEGIPVNVEAGTSAALGVQGLSTVLTLLREAADTDQGILYEAGTGLGFRPRVARYDPAVWAAITMGAGQIAAPITTTDDDQRYRNQWTVSRVNGSFAVAMDAKEIALNGLYDDSTTINSQDDSVLGDYAGWQLHASTYPDQRLPNLAWNLARNPALVPTWRKRTFAPRISITTGLTQLQGAEPNVLAEGYQAQLWPNGWTLVFNCSPAKVWDTSVYDSTAAYLDSSSTTLATAVNTSATSLAVSTALAGDTWETSAFPYDVILNGERMTVTACTAPAGTGPYTQTMTVTRGVDGFTRAHDVGEEVHVYFYAIYAR
jgi:hypothetical protein